MRGAEACAEYAELEQKFFAQDLPQLMGALGIENEPLPLLWTSDFILRDGDTPQAIVQMT